MAKTKPRRPLKKLIDKIQKNRADRMEKRGERLKKRAAKIRGRAR